MKKLFTFLSLFCLFSCLNDDYIVNPDNTKSTIVNKEEKREIKDSISDWRTNVLNFHRNFPSLRQKIDNNILTATSFDNCASSCHGVPIKPIDLPPLEVPGKPRPPKTPPVIIITPSPFPPIYNPTPPPPLPPSSKPRIEDILEGYDKEWTEEDLPPSCSAFSFSRVGTANWQEAGVSNITQGFMSITYHPFHIYIGGIHFPQAIYFGLPIKTKNDYYTSGRAAKISADCLYKAYRDTNTYFNGNPKRGVNMTILNEYFLKRAKFYMKKYNGTVSIYPANGSNTTIKDYKEYYFFEDDCE